MNQDNNSFYSYNNEAFYGDQRDLPPPRKFSAYESAFAWLSFFLGYLFCRFYTFTIRSLGAFLLALILIAVTGGILLIQKKKLSILACAIGISTLLVAFSMLFSRNYALQLLSRAYCIVSYVFFVYTATQNQCENKNMIGDFFGCMSLFVILYLMCMVQFILEN